MFAHDKWNEWIDKTCAFGQFSSADYAVHLPLMSAPHVLGVESIRSEVPYLFPPRRHIELGQSHVPDAKLRIGFAWSGRPTHPNDHHRSCPLAHWLPLFKVAEVAFYSLQKGAADSETARLLDQLQNVRDLDPLQNDFADTAAIMDQLDLIITVDTSTLHLAGGLAGPVWGLLSRRCDWRWETCREDSDWYPTLRLFRQKAVDDWDELMPRVAAALVELRDGLP